METLVKNITQKTENSENVPIIEVAHLEKAFGDNFVLRDFNITVYPGESVVVMGKSGIGKTVLIKCIIGLLKADAGTLRVFGNDISQLSHQELDDLRMRIGFVFQNSALYDSMTVRQNLEFPLRRHRMKITTDMDTLVRETLRNVGLEHTIDMMPSELSGGMRKRIGIARSLILKPKIVLYDEPTTGLDPITSGEIAHWMKELQIKYHTASIIITHDIELAKEVGDRLVFIVDGIAYLQGAYNELVNTEDPKIKPFFK